MRELRELARTAGTEVADCVVQLREHVDPKFVMGKGKLEEVVVRAMQLDAGVLVFDRELTPAQASAIAKHTDLKVIDRTQLILDIFAQRAESRDGKLQVELAQLKYAMPRLAQKDDSLSRLTGGIGGRGPGETKLEIGRRRAKDRVTHLEHAAQAARQAARAAPAQAHARGRAHGGHRRLHERRQEHAAQHADGRRRPRRGQALRHARHALARRCAAAGRAGASARSSSPTPSASSATCRRTSSPPSARRSRRRPTPICSLHVVDASDPAMEEHIRTVMKVLEDLELLEIPRLLVFNKIDARRPRPSCACSSGRHPGRGLRERDRTASRRGRSSSASRASSPTSGTAAPVARASSRQPERAGRPTPRDPSRPAR